MLIVKSKILCRMPPRSTKRKSKKQSKGKSASRKSSKALHSVVINTSNDMHKYYRSAKKHDMLVVLVKAEWCGHCKTYMANVWKKLEAIQRSLQRKKVGMVQMDEQALPSSPLKSAKINGYPSLLLIGKDGKPAEFEDEQTGEPTNAVPNANSLPMMQSIVSGATPEEVSASGPAAAPVAAAISSTNASSAAVEDSPPLTEEAENSKNNSSAILLDSLNSPIASGAVEEEDAGVSVSSPPTPDSEDLSTTAVSNASTVLPPTAEDDLLDTYSGATASGSENSSQLGGSLYMSLVEAAKTAAPAAALLAAGTVLSKRGKRSTKKLRR
jgi:thiol-disulfide isomerase/thioredoxin